MSLLNNLKTVVDRELVRVKKELSDYSIESYTELRNLSVSKELKMVLDGYSSVLSTPDFCQDEYQYVLDCILRAIKYKRELQSPTTADGLLDHYVRSESLENEIRILTEGFKLKPEHTILKKVIGGRV